MLNHELGRPGSRREMTPLWLHLAILFSFGVLVTDGSLPSHVLAADPSPDGIRVEYDQETFRTTIRVALDQGRVSWSDVARGLARAQGYDDEALEDILPKGQLDLTSSTWRWTRLGLNLALAPHFRFAVSQPHGGGPRHLVIQLDQAALMASQRRFKALLREGLMRVLPGRAATYGLTLDPDWQQTVNGKRLVVFVHGIQSDAHRAERLLGLLRRHGLPCGVIEYPNDQPIVESAVILARELAEVAEKQRGLQVTLLTHSMGGLVAREVIENPDLDPGNVVQLIMVAPPNSGSQLARFAFALELWECVRSDDRRGAVARFYRSIEDGLSEASVDLRPDSLFLRQLNRRPRNPNVAYTVLLGTRGPLSAEDLEDLRESFRLAGQRSRWVRFFGPRVDEWLADLDEVVAGKGDGVVAVSRGRLAGVDDTVLLEFQHIDMLQVHNNGPLSPLHQMILDRLGVRDTFSDK